MNRATLIPAIKEGKVSEATIDDKARRILRKAIEYGFLDRPQTDTSIPVYSQEGREVALQTAREGMVLLKNEGNLLPLDKMKLKTMAVVGPNAFPSVPGGGGSWGGGGFGGGGGGFGGFGGGSSGGGGASGSW